MSFYIPLFKQQNAQGKQQWIIHYKNGTAFMLNYLLNAFTFENGESIILTAVPWDFNTLTPPMLLPHKATNLPIVCNFLTAISTWSLYLHPKVIYWPEKLFPQA